MNKQLRSALVGSATAIALLAVPGAALASQDNGNGEMPPGMSVMMNAPGHDHFMTSPGHDHVMTSPGHMAMMR